MTFHFYIAVSLQTVDILLLHKFVLNAIVMLYVRVRIRVMVYNTFRNISVISWRSVLLMEETRVL